jgi:hypothetical protein
MTSSRRPQPANVTDQDLRALISKVDRILQLLEAEPPRAPQHLGNDERFYPGVGTVRPTRTEPPQPSPTQLAAAAALDARDT